MIVDFEAIGGRDAFRLAHSFKKYNNICYWIKWFLQEATASEGAA
jgi:hypothetical protein